MRPDSEENRIRFDAWLRGELPPAELPFADEEAMFAALAADPELAAEAAASREVVQSLRGLPPAIAPATDLWPAIAAAIQVEQPQPRTRSIVRVRQTLLALAASLVALVGGTAVWRSLHDPAPLAVVVAPTPATPVIGLPASLAAYAETDQELGAIGDELRRTIEARQEKLPPATRALVFENLRTIDRALAEIELALRAAPADPALARTYIAYRERQIDVLRQANRMAARL
jgi:hypothetical protein